MQRKIETMNKSAITFAALIGMSALSAPAYAQTKEVLPNSTTVDPAIEGAAGSDTAIELQEAEERDGVAEGTGAETTTTTGMSADAPANPPATANSSEIMLDEATERDAVATGTSAETTTETGMTTPATESTSTANTNEIKLKEGEERNAVAAGTDAETKAPDGSTMVPAAK